VRNKEVRRYGKWKSEEEIEKRRDRNWEMRETVKR
jgi:hypothetical protein